MYKSLLLGSSGSLRARRINEPKGFYGFACKNQGSLNKKAAYLLSEKRLCNENNKAADF
jgi:hypothetical protein